MSRLCLYYRPEAEANRWVYGDRLIRPFLRRLIRGKPRLSGIEKVFVNLCIGLDRLGVPYHVNLPFARLRDSDRVGLLGVGRQALNGYRRSNPIVAGPTFLCHPSEWPSLCRDEPIAAYLQHSEWATQIFRGYFGTCCRVWPVGIDTDAWSPKPCARKRYDVLLYDKILWRREEMVPALLDPVRAELARRSLSYVEIRYGLYSERQYSDLLRDCNCMIFLCEHESQGLAYQEALACDVPVLAWDQGWWLDPNRFGWGTPEVPATSVPYFSEACGLRFAHIGGFADRLTEFLDLQSAGAFAPREYILRHLTLEKCARHYLDILGFRPA